MYFFAEKGKSKKLLGNATNALDIKPLPFQHLIWYIPFQKNFFQFIPKEFDVITCIFSIIW